MKAGSWCGCLEEEEAAREERSVRGGREEIWGHVHDSGALEGKSGGGPGAPPDRRTSLWLSRGSGWHRRLRPRTHAPGPACPAPRFCTCSCFWERPFSSPAGNSRPHLEERPRAFSAERQLFSEGSRLCTVFGILPRTQPLKTTLFLTRIFSETRSSAGPERGSFLLLWRCH